MKVGTDGTLLGAWVSVVGKAKALDVGTGTGLIALMLAQREPLLGVVAIEMDGHAAEQAKDNIFNSPYADRVEVLNMDFNNYHSIDKFDLIVCNPPFFSPNPGKANSQKRIDARQQVNLNYEQLFIKSAEILAANGQLSIVVPFVDLDQINNIATNNGMYPNRITTVQGHKNAPTKRVLLAFGLKKVKVQTQNLILKTLEGIPTKDYTLLCKDFYLKF